MHSPRNSLAQAVGTGVCLTFDHDSDSQPPGISGRLTTCPAAGGVQGFNVQTFQRLTLQPRFGESAAASAAALFALCLHGG